MSMHLTFRQAFHCHPQTAKTGKVEVVPAVPLPIAVSGMPSAIDTMASTNYS